MTNNTKDNLEIFLKETFTGRHNVRNIIEFTNCAHIVEQIRYVEWLMNNHGIFDKIKMELKTNGKNNKLSVNHRNESMKFLKNRLYDLAIYEINKSICYASTTITNNLSQAYIHRASINDCYNFLEENYDAVQNIRLAKKSLNEKSPKMLDEINEKDKHYMLKAFTFSLAKIKINKNGIGEDNGEITESVPQQKFCFNSKLSYTLHEKFPFIGSCLDVKKTDDHRKYVLYTKIALKSGDYIAVEKSFVNVLKSNDVYLNCLNCSKSDKMGGLIPCENCSCAMFCSDECKNEANSKFHKYECKISNFLKDDINNRYAILLSIRIILILLDLFDNNMNNFKDFIDDQEKCGNCTIFDDTNTNWTGDYMKNMSNEKLIKLKQYQTFFMFINDMKIRLNLDQSLYLTSHICILKKALMCTPLKDVIESRHAELFYKLLTNHIIYLNQFPNESMPFCTLKVFCKSSINSNSILTLQNNEWILTIKEPIPPESFITINSHDGVL